MVTDQRLWLWWNGQFGSPERAANVSESTVPVVICIAHDSDGRDSLKLINVSQCSQTVTEIIYAINMHNLETMNPGTIQQCLEETFVIRTFHNEQIISSDFNSPWFSSH